jgi:hypothetical protein
MIYKSCIRKSTSGFSGLSCSPCSTSFGVTGPLNIYRVSRLSSFPCCGGVHEGEMQDIVSSGKKPRSKGSVNTGLKKKKILKVHLLSAHTWACCSFRIYRSSHGCGCDHIKVFCLILQSSIPGHPVRSCSLNYSLLKLYVGWTSPLSFYEIQQERDSSLYWGWIHLTIQPHILHRY